MGTFREKLIYCSIISYIQGLKLKRKNLSDAYVCEHNFDPFIDFQVPFQFCASPTSLSYENTQNSKNNNKIIKSPWNNLKKKILQIIRAF